MPTRFVVHPGPLPPGVVSVCGYASEDLEPGVHRGLPSPWVTLILAVDGQVRVDGTVGDGGFDPGRAEAYDVLVAGLHDVAAQVEQPRCQAGVQVALHPLAVEPLLGCRAADLATLHEHGRDVIGAPAGELHDRVGSSTGTRQQVDLVVGWLASRAAARHREPSLGRPEVSQAFTGLQRPGVRVEDVAREVRLSPRQLHTLVQRETGWTPKRLARMSRFAGVVADLGAGADLAGSAARRGYADQGHLTREFTQMAGCSPTAWLAEERRNLQDGGHRHRAVSTA